MREFTLTVTQEELNKIGVALGAMPYNQVGSLIAKLDIQLSQQQEQVKPEGENVVEVESTNDVISNTGTTTQVPSRTNRKQ